MCIRDRLRSEAEELKLAARACTETMTGFNVQSASSSGTMVLGLGVASLLSQADALHSKIQDLYPNIQEDAEAVAGMEDALSVIKRMRMHLRHVERPGRTEEEEGPAAEAVGPASASMVHGFRLFSSVAGV